MDLQSDELTFDLLAVGSALSKETAERVDSLSKTSGTAVSAQFFFAARDLWRTFCQGGDRRLLPILEKVALHAYASSILANAPDYRRRHVLRLWMSAQLPQKILAWPIDALLDDMTLLYKEAGIFVPGHDVEFREALIEAFAGELRARQTEGDLTGHRELLDENRDALMGLHQQYLERTEHGGKKPNHDTLAAWDYLFPPVAQLERPPGPVTKMAHPGFRGGEVALKP